MSDQDDDLFADSDESGDTDDLIAESKQKPIAKPKKKKILKKKKASSGGGNKRKRIPGKYFYSLFLSLSRPLLYVVLTILITIALKQTQLLDLVIVIIRCG